MYKDSVKLENTTGAFRWSRTESLQLGLPAKMLSILNIPAGITSEKMFETLCQQYLNILVVLLKITGFPHSRKKSEFSERFSLWKEWPSATDSVSRLWLSWTSCSVLYPADVSEGFVNDFSNKRLAGLRVSTQWRENRRSVYWELIWLSYLLTFETNNLVTCIFKELSAWVNQINSVNKDTYNLVVNWCVFLKENSFFFLL